MALIDDVKTAYRAVTRVDIGEKAANDVAIEIANGAMTLDVYITTLIAQNISTTGASIAVAAFVTGVTPTSAKLDALKIEADKQVASYAKLGVANPALGAFEAFGKGFAEDAATGFAAKYGALSTTDFINAVYIAVNGAGPTDGAFANLSAQIDYFADLYVTAGGFADAALSAKGAVLGQIVGYAFIDPTSIAASDLDNRVAAALTALAKGDASGYGKALPTDRASLRSA